MRRRSHGVDFHIRLRIPMIAGEQVSHGICPELTPVTGVYTFSFVSLERISA